MSDLSQVTILITSFLRHGYCDECLRGIQNNLPECKVIVVDDSYELPGADLHFDVGDLLHLPFDSGLPAKRNAGAAACVTPFLLMGSDDFQFGTPEVRDGIERMVGFLDRFPDVGVVAGRVNDNPYEGFLEYKEGEYIQETRLDVSKVSLFARVDIAVNYFLARIEVLRKFPYDPRMKIGGEHGDSMLTWKENGVKMFWLKGVNINEQPYDPMKQDPEYARYRARARELGHAIFLQKRNIKEYRGFA